MQYGLFPQRRNVVGSLHDDEEASYLKEFRRRFPNDAVCVAEQTLGQAYLDGWGVAKDDTQAAQWYRKAAQQGLPRAARFIGLLTAFGQGVEKDCAVAKNWLADAKAGGDTEAANYLASGAGGCKW